MSSRSMVAAVAVLAALVAAAPAEAEVRASGELRRISLTRYELHVRNTGDELFHAMSFYPPSQITVVSPPRTSHGSCWAPWDNGFNCGFLSFSPGETRVFRFRTDRTYPSGAGGRLFAFETNPETGEPAFHGSAVSGPPPAAGQPVAGRLQLVRPVRGVVRVRRRGSRRFVPLRRGQLLPDRSEIDTRRGAAQITVASDGPGGQSTATVSEGRAIIDQDRARRPTTTLKLSEPLACPPRLAFAAAAAPARNRRRIFVKTKGGRFRTRGNHAAGTASGTAWRTSDRCSATTIKVAEGTVRVRDLRRRRTLDVTAPSSYTARAR